MAGPNNTPDIQEILKSAALLLAPDQVYELRSFGKDKYKTVYSGYFDDYQKLALAAAQLNGRSAGIYITANPVNPALLARAANQVKERPAATTADPDVICRRWLPVDVDPVRPSNISSTEAEHQLATDRALEVVAWLTSLGWPLPGIADSGNGCHLLYRIDLPNDREATDLVQNCLKALSLQFDDGAVSVDTSVYNAARIWKLYGTLACKGDDIPERPHRMSHIMEAPDSLEVVPLDLLQELASRLPEEPKGEDSRQYSRTGTPFDLEVWLEEHQIAIRREGPWNNRYRWVLKQCVWDPGHDDNAAYVVRFANGAIAAGCHHNHCQGKRWAEFREAVEPSYRDRRSSSTPEEPTAWEDPQPFETFDLPEFPLHALPPDLAEYVRQEAVAMQVPTALPACLVLGATASAAAKKAVIRLKVDWLEPLNEYFNLVLPSGERKSPQVRSVLGPLYDYETLLIQQKKLEVLKATTNYEILERKWKAAKDNAAKAKDDADSRAYQEAAEKLAGDLAEAEVPQHPKLIVDDVTAEALGTMLHQQGGRMALLSTEGGIFETIAGRYSEGVPNLDVYLKAYSGDPLLVDRASPGRPQVRVLNAALTIILTVQPDVVRSLSSKKGFRGRGFLARWSYSIPDSKVGFRDEDPPSVDPAVRDYWVKTITALLEWELTENGKPSEITLAPEAASLFKEFCRASEVKLRPGEELSEIQDWGNKFPGRVARYAAHLHILKWAGSFVRLMCFVQGDRKSEIPRWRIARQKLPWPETRWRRP